MKSYVDLHIHSSFSDGLYNILEIIELLKKENIKYFAICDHDNIESIKFLKDLDLKDIKFISGVEVSSYFEYYGIHILGYYIDGDTSKLEELLNNIKENRKRRMNETLNTIKLRDGITISDNEFDELMNSNNIGKKKLGQILLKHNIGDNYLEIRDKFLKNLHCKTSYRENIKDVCNAIKLAGGIPVLAHPKELEIRYGILLDDVIEKLIENGIEGIEVYHSIHTKEDANRYLEIVKKYNLLISGGSDFHGNSKSNFSLGYLLKNKEICNYEKFTIIK